MLDPINRFLISGRLSHILKLSKTYFTKLLWNHDKSFQQPLHPIDVGYLIPLLVFELRKKSCFVYARTFD